MHIWRTKHLVFWRYIVLWSTLSYVQLALHRCVNSDWGCCSFYFAMLNTVYLFLKFKIVFVFQNFIAYYQVQYDCYVFRINFIWPNWMQILHVIGCPFVGLALFWLWFWLFVCPFGVIQSKPTTSISPAIGICYVEMVLKSAVVCVW